jgi:PhnB protein
MSKRYVAPYINFAGKAREAMEFYRTVLGGTVVLQTTDDQGTAKPTGSGDRISYARLEADGVIIIGSDGHPSYPAKVGDNIALAVGGTDKDRLTKVFSGLAEGGKVKGPIAPQPWNAEVGWLIDKFGVNWMVNIEKA